jgi:hypothetical protein
MFSPKITTRCLIGVLVAGADGAAELADETERPIAAAPNAAALAAAAKNFLMRVSTKAPFCNGGYFNLRPGRHAATRPASSTAGGPLV